MTKEEYNKILEGIELLTENQLRLYREVQELKKLVEKKHDS
ncbi:hypothetical protein [Xanthomarina sp. GH4-25]